MNWTTASMLIRRAAREDAARGIGDPVAAIRRERMPRMSKYHYRSLCQEYERVYKEALSAFADGAAEAVDTQQATEEEEEGVAREVAA